LAAGSGSEHGREVNAASPYAAAVAAERRPGRGRGGHIQLPLDVDEAEDWSALGDDGLALFVRAATSSARNLTDGHITRLAFSRLTVGARRGVAAKLAARLVDAGFWEAEGDGWQVVDWPRYAMTSDEVRAYQARQAAKAPAGGRARASIGERDANGRWIGPGFQPDNQPVSQPTGLAANQPGGQPNASPDTDTDANTVQAVPAEEQSVSLNAEDAGVPVASVGDADAARLPAWALAPRPTDEKEGSGVGVTDPDPVSVGEAGLRVGRRGKRYDPEWPPASEHSVPGWRTTRFDVFRRAWEARGFDDSPTWKQWQVLSRVNEQEPTALARFVAEAPSGLQSNEVIGCVFERLNADPGLRLLIGPAGTAGDAVEESARASGGIETTAPPEEPVAMARSVLAGDLVGDLDDDPVDEEVW